MKLSKAIIDRRRNEILKIIQKEQQIKTSDLAKYFDCSKVTLQRDLQYWEDLGAISHQYGKVTLVQKFIDDPSDFERDRYMNMIAKAASNYIHDGDVIFVNTSATAMSILYYIRNKKVTVITNDSNTIKHFSNTMIKMIFTGGEISSPTNAMIGNYTISMIKKFNATKCFLGNCCITDGNVYCNDSDITLINQTMLQFTKGKKFLLCSHKKAKSSYPFNFASLDDFDYLITDYEITESIIDDIQSYSDINIIKAYPFNE